MAQIPASLSHPGLRPRDFSLSTHILHVRVHVSGAQLRVSDLALGLIYMCSIYTNACKYIHALNLYMRIKRFIVMFVNACVCIFIRWQGHLLHCCMNQTLKLQREFFMYSLQTTSSWKPSIYTCSREMQSHHSPPSNHSDAIFCIHVIFSIFSLTNFKL